MKGLFSKMAIRKINEKRLAMISFQNVLSKETVALETWAETSREICAMLCFPSSSNANSQNSCIVEKKLQHQL